MINVVELVMSNSFRDPLFMSISGSHQDGKDGSSFLAADRQPCLVCGHPTGDCVDETQKSEIGKLVINVSNLETFKGVQKILVEQDMFEERQVSPYAKITIRIARKGSYVTVDRAKELGIIEN